MLCLRTPLGSRARKKSASDDAQPNSPIAQSHSRVREQSKRMTSRRPLPGRPDVPLARLFFQRLIYGSTRGSLGSPRRLGLRAVSIPESATCFDPSSLVALRHRDHPAGFTPPQSSFASSPRSVHLSVRASPRLGSCPLRDFTRAQLPIRKRSQPLASFRPRAFSAPRRFPPRSGSQACFIPLPRPGSRSFRGFSRRAATLARREEPAPLPLAHEPLTCLRRLPQSMRLDFEAFIRTGPRSLPHTLFTCASVAPLLEFLSLRLSLLSASPSLPGALRSRRSPVRPSLSRSPDGLVLSVLSARSLTSRLQPARLLEFSSLPSASPAHETSSRPSSPSRNSVPILHVSPPPGCPRDLLPRRPRRNHHSVAQMMISVPSLSDPKHHPGTQMMSRLGISQPFTARLPVR
jgi:hypothetical protein